MGAGVAVAQAGIFINYRRADTEGYAGRLEDDLVARFGNARVFRDIEILPGLDWILEIERAIGASGAFLVLIGPHWLDRDAQGKRRLDDPSDTLRREIQAAMGRDLVVIPVCVGGASMPAEADLPQPLRPLARLNATYLTQQGWPDDVNRLVHRLEQIVGPAVPATVPGGGRGPGPGPGPVNGGGGSPAAKVVGVLVVVAILAVGGFLIAKAMTGDGPNPSPTTPRIIFPTGFQVNNPKITLDPNSGPLGTTVTVTGTGFPAGGDIEIHANADAVGETTADQAGSFTVQVTIPTSPFPGNVTVTASSGGFFDDALFTVTG